MSGMISETGDCIDVVLLASSNLTQRVADLDEQSIEATGAAIGGKCPTLLSGRHQALSSGVDAGSCTRASFSRTVIRAEQVSVAGSEY